VQQVVAAMPAISFPVHSLEQFLERIVKISRATYRLDYYKRLYYGVPGFLAAPFRLSDTPEADMAASGKGLKFDGVDDYVNCGAGSSLDSIGSITLALWVKVPSATSAYAGLIFKSDGVSHGYDTAMDGFGTGLRMDVYNGTTYTNLSWAGNIADGLWHHLAFSYDGVGGYIRIYVDGAEVANLNAGTGYVTSTTQPLYLGRDPSGGRNFGGTMDDPRVYARVLTPTEIAGLYQLSPPSDSGLRGWWKLDDTTGTA